MSSIDRLVRNAETSITRMTNRFRRDINASFDKAIDESHGRLVGLKGNIPVKPTDDPGLWEPIGTELEFKATGEIQRVLIPRNHNDEEIRCVP